MLMSSCTDCEVSLLRRKTCTHVNSVRLQNLKIQKYFTGVYPRKIQISRPARILVIPYPESTGTRIYLDILGCKIYGVQIWIRLSLVHLYCIVQLYLVATAVLHSTAVATRT